MSSEPCSSYDGSLDSHEETYFGSFYADSLSKMSLAVIKVAEANSDISALDGFKASQIVLQIVLVGHALHIPNDLRGLGVCSVPSALDTCSSSQNLPLTAGCAHVYSRTH